MAYASPKYILLEQSRRRKTLDALKRALPVLRIILIIVICIHIAAILILIFEEKKNNEQFTSFFDALWWAIVTMTTVGYGDKYPTTPAGRVAAIVFMYASIFLVSMFTATISSIFVARTIQEGRGLETVKFKTHTLICGWNSDIPKVLEALNDTSQLQVVLVNDMPPEAIGMHLKAYENLEIRFVRGNFARELVLNRANVRESASAIILPDASLSADHENPVDTRTIEATITIKDMAPDVKVYAHVMEADLVANLRRADIDDVVVSDEHTGHLLASHVASPGTPQILQELLLPEAEHNLRRVKIPDEFVGQESDELFNYFKRERNWILLGYIVEDEGFRLQDALSGGNTAIVDFITRQVQQAGISTTTKTSIRVNLNPSGDYIIETGTFAIVIT